MKNLTITFLLLILSTSLYAAGPALSIEPLYGIERTQRHYPKPAKFTTRTFLGIRATYGTSLLAGEFELSQSNSNEEFPDDNEKVEYKIQRAMVGVRSYPIKSQYVGIFFRAGARAQKQETIIDGPTGEKTEESPLTFDPYAGTGITIAIANNFALSAGATLMYNRNAPASEQYDTQYTFNFTVRAGNR